MEKAKLLLNSRKGKRIWGGEKQRRGARKGLRTVSIQEDRNRKKNATVGNYKGKVTMERGK